MSTAADVPPFLAYFERLLQLDRPGAMTLVERFLAARDGDVAGLYDEVLVPALVHTGLEWQEDRISVAHEHYISEVTRDLILRHGPRLWAAPEALRGTAVACCAPSERHVLGLMMAADILRAAGLEVHLLGEGPRPSPSATSSPRSRPTCSPSPSRSPSTSTRPCGWWPRPDRPGPR